LPRLQPVALDEFRCRQRVPQLLLRRADVGYINELFIFYIFSALI
jgi:hypothetical protein